MIHGISNWTNSKPRRLLLHQQTQSAHVLSTRCPITPNQACKGPPAKSLPRTVNAQAENNQRDLPTSFPIQGHDKQKD